MKGIRKLDVFPKFDRKFEHDARQRTVSGGVMSIVSLIVVALLVIGEVRYFFSTELRHEMFVDPTPGGEMTITLNVTFYRVPCDLMTLDVLDSFNSFAPPDSRQIVKTRVVADTLQPISRARDLVDEKHKVTVPIDPDGAVKEGCPSCYGAERTRDECCHTCEDVRVAYQRKGWKLNVDDISVAQCAEERVRNAALALSKEGCNLYGAFTVPRVTGRVQFIPGRAFAGGLGGNAVDYMMDTVRHLNLSHIIHTLQFGAAFPGQSNPLDGVQYVRGKGTAGKENSVNGRFSYFVKVVPTRYEGSSALLASDPFGLASVESNQYSVTRHFTSRESVEKEQPNGEVQLIGGVFVMYDVSPIKVRIRQERPYRSVVHFLLQLCAVCGGVLTVAGLLDSLFFHGASRVKKMREGKYH